jgi:hypothetical protein
LGRAEEKFPAALVEQEMLAELMHSWTGEYRSVPALQAELAKLQDKMRRLFERIFAH